MHNFNVHLDCSIGGGEVATPQRSVYSRWRHRPRGSVWAEASPIVRDYAMIMITKRDYNR